MSEIVLNCLGNEVPIEIFPSETQVNIRVNGRCTKLDDDSRCQQSGEYCMLLVRKKSEEDWDGEEEIIDLDEDDL